MAGGGFAAGAGRGFGGGGGMKVFRFGADIVGRGGRAWRRGGDGRGTVVEDTEGETEVAVEATGYGGPAVGIGGGFALLHQVDEHASAALFDGDNVFEEAVALILEDGASQTVRGRGGNDGGIEGVEHGDTAVFVEGEEGELIDEDPATETDVELFVEGGDFALLFLQRGETIGGRHGVQTKHGGGYVTTTAHVEIFEIIESREGLGEVDEDEFGREAAMEKVDDEAGGERGGLLGELGDLVHERALKGVRAVVMGREGGGDGRGRRGGIGRRRSEGAGITGGGGSRGTIERVHRAQRDFVGEHVVEDEGGGGGFGRGGVGCVAGVHGVRHDGMAVWWYDGVVVVGCWWWWWKTRWTREKRKRNGGKVVAL